ncbi:PP0621 family protein [Campylobacter fetus]|uniref:Prokaryotic metallothionein family protein n=1 Tax=Campylobacter fetus subsp. testudinum TaxID=1507806 RepID=A0AAX0HC69_CAMFE|nr:PP0621 family protein [Campylobacter fetus]ALV65547.1 hypothetical protein CFTSP3_1600 [Campylobacter fetus subsp. testudinum Sp3]AVK81791.1 hypothetical protein C6B32_08185 [Campylobacter fetus subsp. testudinum]MPB72180.1 hypothetical protein [Campylobacter fetus]MPB78030.1 hypothetical protein [Campylobacter fetus]OCR86989.1 hypothetical protein CFT13S00388_06580 [Campylobacter fetus subsp. testudinum]
MLGKIIIFALIIAAIYFFILSKFRKNKPSNSSENFVECDKCKTFVSINEAVLKNGKYICKECLK